MDSHSLAFVVRVVQNENSGSVLVLDRAWLWRRHCFPPCRFCDDIGWRTKSKIWITYKSVISVLFRSIACHLIRFEMCGHCSLCSNAKNEKYACSTRLNGRKITLYSYWKLHFTRYSAYCAAMWIFPPFGFHMLPTKFRSLVGLVGFFVCAFTVSDFNQFIGLWNFSTYSSATFLPRSFVSSVLVLRFPCAKINNGKYLHFSLNRIEA